MFSGRIDGQIVLNFRELGVGDKIRDFAEPQCPFANYMQISREVLLTSLWKGWG